MRRALLSVSDKTGIVEFARALHDEFGVTLLSTGGTAKALRDAGLPVTDVSDITGFPEMMAGRVKTLHPKVHGALLGRLPQDEAVMQEHGIEPIDLVCVNLYPFHRTVMKPDVTDEEAIENIDIGGPSMLRSAAKNHARVTVVCSPIEYENVLDNLRKHDGHTTLAERRTQAGFAFNVTNLYDGDIASYLHGVTPLDLTEHNLGRDAATMPLLSKEADLRYGENPHQQAALYWFGDTTRAGYDSLALAKQHHGKEMGYINYLDADAAMNVVREFDASACCIVKHATPCGAGQADTLRQAFVHAHASDPLAAFGGVVAFNRRVDADAANAIGEGEKFLEVIIAPGYDDEALLTLKTRWKNIRLLDVKQLHEPAGTDRVLVHQINGGLLAQQRDLVGVVESEWKVASDRQPTDAELAAMKFNWLVCKHVKSNAIVIGGEHGTYGIGGGQVDRVSAAEHAIKKAGDRAKGAVAASDAFFPFPDGPKALLDAGVTAIVQPGGSVRDQETIDLVNERNAAMIFTGRRHFRH